MTLELKAAELAETERRLHDQAERQEKEWSASLIQLESDRRLLAEAWERVERERIAYASVSELHHQQPCPKPGPATECPGRSSARRRPGHGTIRTRPIPTRITLLPRRSSDNSKPLVATFGAMPQERRDLSFKRKQARIVSLQHQLSDPRNAGRGSDGRLRRDSDLSRCPPTLLTFLARPSAAFKLVGSPLRLACAPAVRFGGKRDRAISLPEVSGQTDGKLRGYDSTPARTMKSSA